MKTSHMILSAASVLPLLSSCASQQQAADNQLWNIKPVYNVRHSSETPENYYRLGRYYQGQKRYEQALDAYRKALAIDGNFAEALNGIGVIYAMQGRQQEAVDQFRLAVKRAPEAAHIQNNLGYALYLNDAYAEAVVVLDKAVALDPANQSANTNLALALDKVGDRNKAVQVMAVAAAKSRPIMNALPEPETVAVQQTQTGSRTPTPASAIAATASTSPAGQQMLALPKDWGLITQAAPKPVDQAGGPVLSVRPNSYEVRKQTEVDVQMEPAAKPMLRASVQTKGPAMVVAQAAQKPVSVAELHVRTAPQPSSAAEQKTVAAVQSAKPLQQASVKMERAVAQAAVKLSPASELRIPTAAQTSTNAVMPQARTAAQIAKPYRIEVSNGNGVTGMARKVAGFLNKEGDAKARLTNQKPFQVASSQVQYRSGYREQAQSLASALPGQPAIAQANNLRVDISVRILLGKDVARNVAYFEPGQKKIRLARNGSDS